MRILTVAIAVKQSTYLAASSNDDVEMGPPGLTKFADTNSDHSS